MSNRTPAAIRARDKQRKAKEKQGKRLLVDVAPNSKSRVLLGAKLTWSLIGFIITITTAVLTFLPHLTLAPNGTVRPHDAMGTVFNLTNDGLPVFDVEQFCDVNITADNGRPIIGGLGSLNIGMKPLGRIGTWETKSLNCQHSVAGFNAQTTLTIVIKYRPLLWFSKMAKAFPLQAERADDGTWVWKSL